jgi:integrase
MGTIKPVEPAKLIIAGEILPSHIIAQQQLIALATNGLEDATRRAYEKNLVGFFHWVTMNDKPFSRASVLEYKQAMMDQDYAPATINQALSSIRRLATEGKYVGLDPLVADGIITIKGVKKGGRRLGKWLSPAMIKILFDVTDPNSLRGHQERVVLSLLAGAALRRQEASDLTFEHVQERDDIWLIVDLVGKRNKTRSIPLSPWVKKNIDKWGAAAGIDSGYILRAVNQKDRLMGCVPTKGGGTTNGGLSPKGIYIAVTRLAKRAGFSGLGPHSLRRTWARRAYKQGYPLDQIQAILGHDSIRTTELYLGLRGLDLESPVYVTY